jgi:hypothetical protein
MLRAIEITNFKGVGETVRIPIRPITLMFGANSSGKSTILHALHYAHEVLNHRNFDVDVTERGGASINLGGFKNLIHNRDLRSNVTLAFEVDLEDIDLPEYSVDADGYNISAEVNSARISFTIGWSHLEAKPIPLRYEVAINGIDAAQLILDSGGRDIYAHYNIKHPLVASMWGEESIEGYEEWPPIQIANLSSVIPTWRKQLAYVLRDDVEYLPMGEHIISQVLVGVGEVFAEYLAKMRYVGPIRSIMPRNYEQVLSRSELRWSDGSAAWDCLLSSSSEFVKRVGDWLGGESKLNTGYDLKLRSFKEIDLETPLAIAIRQETALDDIENLKSSFEKLPTRRKLTVIHKQSLAEFSPHDLGIGISQIIPVITTSLLNSSEFVAIEQPELHIHPAVQVGLGDLFTSQIKERNCLFLIETHSEHMILRILRRIREAHEQELPPDSLTITPDDISVVFLEYKNNQTCVSNIRISKDGDFVDNWPKGFFEERAGELF